MNQYLRKLNNFHTLMGIVAGLNTSSVNRLKATKSDLPKKVLSVSVLSGESSSLFEQEIINVACCDYIDVPKA